MSTTEPRLDAYPTLAAQWHPERNDRAPGEVLAMSRRRAWWLCPNGHEYEINVAVRVTDDYNCPVCGR